MQIWNRIRLVRYQNPAQTRSLFYSKPEGDVHVTEMIIYDLFLFIGVAKNLCGGPDNRGAVGAEIETIYHIV